jgi:hypothetical protein
MTDDKTPLTDELTKHIRKLIKPLKYEDELATILKVKLTKKEFKIFKNWANNENLTELLEKLSIDDERYISIKEKLIKKINQEKLKQEIMI